MSEDQIQSIKEDLKEIKDGLNNLNTTVVDLRLLVAQKYVKRDELEENRKEILNKFEKLEIEHKNDIEDIKNERYKIAGLIGTVVGFITSIIFAIINVFK